MKTIGTWYGAKIKVATIVEKHDGWRMNLPNLFCASKLEKILDLIARPQITFPFIKKITAYNSKKGAFKPLMDEVTGEIEEIKIIVKYKER